ncbi:hypothetical protein KI387_013704 [Taxus chinensis]|uniref:Uncharacterized protein n=1 Tax=Taxus chinensis TaxID=29808 RepID=A0AA38CIS5_TAXCH|nr:hypothetical protein KI387_013704 [Taxus chinensis]
MATRSPPCNQDMSRTETQAAFEKAEELRAFHAALVRKLKSHKSPYPAVSRHSRQLSAHDYPVFTPTYDEEAVPVYQQIQLNPRRRSLNWDEGQEDEVESICTDKGSPLIVTRRNSGLFSRGLASSTIDQSLCTNSSTHHVAGLLSSFGNGSLQMSKSNEIDVMDGEKTPNEAESTISWNECNPAALGREFQDVVELPQKKKATNSLLKSCLFFRSRKKTNKSHSYPNKAEPVVPLTEFQDVKEKATNSLLKSWLKATNSLLKSRLCFQAKKKTNKSHSSANKAEPPVFYQSTEESAMELEALKQKLGEANENRDTAVAEVTEMRSSMDELEKKLRQLELYCKDLTHALRQTAQDGSNADFDRNGIRKHENTTI